MRSKYYCKVSWLMWSGADPETRLLILADLKTDVPEGYKLVSEDPTPVNPTSYNDMALPIYAVWVAVPE
jgi:hypothetical protein